MFTEVIARFLGLFFILLPLSLRFNMQQVEALRRIILENVGMQLFFGLMPLLIGSFVVAAHNIWQGSWHVIFVSVVGWLIFLTGVYRLFFLKHWLNQVKRHTFNQLAVPLMFLVMLGVLLLSVGLNFI